MSNVDVSKCKGTIHGWKLVIDNGGDSFRAPEMCSQRIAGKFDGKSICTSSPIATRGRYVRTRSGSVYRLGQIDPGYRAWIRKQKLPYNPRNPLGSHADVEGAP